MGGTDAGVLVVLAWLPNILAPDVLIDDEATLAELAPLPPNIDAELVGDAGVAVAAANAFPPKRFLPTI